MIPVFDGHNDSLIADDATRLAGGRAQGHVDLARMRAGGMRGGIFALFTPSAEKRRKTVRQADGVLATPLDAEVSHERAAAWSAKVADRLFALERENHLAIGRAIADVDRALTSDGPPVAVLHFEGAEAIDEHLEALDVWYGLGLRSLGPVWSRANWFGHGVPFVFPSSPDTGPGLTEAGKALVKRCCDLGILVDLSHLNEAGFWDAARLDVGPLVVSHAGAHTLAPCSRNVTDRQLDAIRDTGGLIGIIYATRFLRDDFSVNPDTPLALVADHVCYVADRIGVEHVALGSDFDGAVISDDLGDAAGLPRLIEVLRARGLTEQELEQVAWRNWRRVLAAWW